MNMANQNVARNHLRVALGCVTAYFLSLIVFFSVAWLIAFMMLQSDDVEYQIHDAKLTRFALDHNYILNYNLSLSFTLRNSNDYIGVHYEEFKARVYYLDAPLLSSVVSFNSFYQGHKSRTVLEAVFQGQDLLLLGDDGRFEDDIKRGAYGIDVMVSIMMMRVLFGHLVTKPMGSLRQFHVIVPFGPSNSTGGV